MTCGQISAGVGGEIAAGDGEFIRRFSHNSAIELTVIDIHLDILRAGTLYISLIDRCRASIGTTVDSHIDILLCCMLRDGKRRIVNSRTVAISIFRNFTTAAGHIAIVQRQLTGTNLNTGSSATDRAASNSGIRIACKVHTITIRSQCCVVQCYLRISNNTININP